MYFQLCLCLPWWNNEQIKQILNRVISNTINIAYFWYRRDPLLIANKRICHPLGSVRLKNEKMVLLRLPVPSMIHISNDSTDEISSSYSSRLEETSSPMLTANRMLWTSLKTRSSRTRHQSHPSLGLRNNLQNRFIEIRNNAGDQLQRFLPINLQESHLLTFSEPLRYPPKPIPSLRKAKLKRSVLHGRLQKCLHKKVIPKPIVSREDWIKVLRPPRETSKMPSKKSYPKPIVSQEDWIKAPRQNAKLEPVDDNS